MLLDAVLLLIILHYTIKGGRRGFSYMAVKLLCFVGAAAGGLLIAGLLKETLKQSSPGKYISSAIGQKFSDSFSEAGDAVAGLLSIFHKDIDGVEDGSSDMIANLLSGMMVAAMSFLAIFIVLLIISNLLFSLLMKKRRKGILGTADRLAGGLTGAAKGILIALILTGIVIPALILLSMGDTGKSAFLINQTGDSVAYRIIHDTIMRRVFGIFL